MFSVYVTTDIISRLFVSSRQTPKRRPFSTWHETKYWFDAWWLTLQCLNIWAQMSFTIKTVRQQTVFRTKVAAPVCGIKAPWTDCLKYLLDTIQEMTEFYAAFTASYLHTSSARQNIWPDHKILFHSSWGSYSYMVRGFSWLNKTHHESKEKLDFNLRSPYSLLL